MAGWSRYGKDFSSSANIPWSTLGEVSHVAHIRTARRIIDDGTVKRALIYDESILKRTRTTVTWVSPNHWTYGFRYGTVKFNFNWIDLIKDKKMFWVEAMTDYNPTACRFMLTNQPLKSALKYLISYDPNSDDGPLRFHKGGWFWRSDYTLEFMVDGDLDLDLCTSIDFVRHHRDFCNEHNTNCSEKRLTPQAAGSRILGALIGNDIKSHNLIMLDKGAKSGLQFPIESAIAWLYTILNPGSNAKGPITDTEQAKDIIAAAALQVGHEQTTTAKSLTKTISSEIIFDRAFRELVGDHFKIGILKFETD